MRAADLLDLGAHLLEAALLTGGRLGAGRDDEGRGEGQHERSDEPGGKPDAALHTLLPPCGWTARAKHLAQEQPASPPAEPFEQGQAHPVNHGNVHKPERTSTLRLSHHTESLDPSARRV
jgi:hypothetical protein